MLNYSEKMSVQKIAEMELIKLGWIVRPSSSISRVNEKSPLLREELKSSLIELNPGIFDDQINEVFLNLESKIGLKFDLKKNKEKYLFMKNGIEVTIRDRGQLITKKIRLIDFNNPERNKFTAIPQMRIKGQYTENLCIPDLIGFVNGIPLLFVQFEREKFPLENIYKKYYQQFLEKIPQLFAFNAFCVLSNGITSKIGSVGSDFEFFWRLA